MTGFSGARLKKYKDIASLLIRYGGGDLFKRSSIDGLKLDEVEGPSVARDATRLAAELEALGPTFVKLGQLLSTRSDLLPPQYLDALARLQDRVEPVPFEDIRGVVEAELERPLNRAFRSLAKKPIAAASLAQVHSARLPGGRHVAVKVQRPDVRQQIEEDLEVLQRIAELADNHTQTGTKYEFQSVLTEFRKSLVAELDFTQEAQNMAVIRRNLAGFDRILVPEPIDTHTTARVLTMEYVDARKIARAAAGADGPALADQLFTAYLQQILVDGLFHADPHPGNVLLTRDGRLALLDLGMVGRLSSSMQEDMLKLMLAMSAGDARETADLAIKLSEVRDGFEEAAFRREMTDLILRYRDASLSQIPVGRVVVDMTRLAVENGLRIVPELTLMAKTLLNLDEVARVLEPDFDPHAALRLNAASLMQRRMLDALSPANVFTSMLETREFVQALPARANRIAEALARNELRFKVEMIDEGAVIEGLQKVANRIAVGLVLAALILGAALLMQVDTSFKILGYPGLAMLLFLAAAAGGLWLSVMVLANDRGRHLRLPWKRAPD